MQDGYIFNSFFFSYFFYFYFFYLFLFPFPAFSLSFLILYFPFLILQHFSSISTFQTQYLSFIPSILQFLFLAPIVFFFHFSFLSLVFTLLFANLFTCQAFCLSFFFFFTFSFYPLLLFFYDHFPALYPVIDFLHFFLIFYFLFLHILLFFIFLCFFTFFVFYFSSKLFFLIELVCFYISLQYVQCFPLHFYTIYTFFLITFPKLCCLCLTRQPKFYHRF